MSRATPRKRAGIATGRRRLAGALLDIPALAAKLGESEKAARAQIARGMIPYRRLGGRIVVLADELDRYLQALPGVTVEQALEASHARNGHGEGRPG